MCLERVIFKFLEGQGCERIQKLVQIFMTYFSRLHGFELEDFRGQEEIEQLELNFNLDIIVCAAFLIGGLLTS